MLDHGTKKTIMVDNMIMIILSMVVSVWVGLICNPGMFYTDSYARWSMAMFIANGLPQGETMLTIVPQLLMGLCYKLTDSFLSYTILQSFLFYYSVFALLWCFEVVRRKTLWVLFLLLCICPIFQVYSVFIEPSIGVLAAMNFLLVFIHQFQFYKHTKPLTCFCIFFVLFTILFGYRQNTLTLLAVIAAAIWIYLPNILKWCAFAAIVCSLVFIFTLPDSFKLQKVDNSAQGAVWETISMIEMLDKEEYKDYLDYAGNTRNAIKNNSWQTMNGSMRDETTINPDMTRIPAISKRVKSDYQKLIMKEPVTFIKMKLRFWSRTLGIEEPLLNIGMYSNFDDRLDGYGYRPTELRDDFLDNFNKFMEKMSVLRRPYILFLLAGFLIFLYSKSYKIRISQEPLKFMCIVYAMAVFYYSAFLVTTQSHEFRYFFPSFVLLVLIIIAIGAAFAAGFIRKLYDKFPQIERFSPSSGFWLNAAVIAILAGPIVGIYLYGVISPYIISKDILRNGIARTNGYGAIISYDPVRNILAYNPDNPLITAKARFFLHIYEFPDPGAKAIDDGAYINYDYMSNRPGNLIGLPKLNVMKIDMGQFNNEKRVWEATIWAAKTVVAANLTNSDWNSGISIANGWYKSRNIILFENKGQNASLLRSVESVILADGSIRVVEDVEMDDKWIRVFVEGRGIDPACGYPNVVALIY